MYNQWYVVDPMSTLHSHLAARDLRLQGALIPAYLVVTALLATHICSCICKWDRNTRLYSLKRVFDSWVATVHQVTSPQSPWKPNINIILWRFIEDTTQIKHFTQPYYQAVVMPAWHITMIILKSDPNYGLMFLDYFVPFKIIFCRLTSVIPQWNCRHPSAEAWQIWLLWHRCSSPNPVEWNSRRNETSSWSVARLASGSNWASSLPYKQRAGFSFPLARYPTI